MSNFTDQHLSSLDLLLNSRIKQVREQLPTYGDAFEKRVREDLRRPFGLLLEQVDSVRTSSRYTNPKQETRLLAHSFTEQKLVPLRRDTVEKLEAQRQARQEAVLGPKKTEKDPARALVHELRLQEVRRELRTLDPLVLQVRFRQAATTAAGDLLLDAIESDPIAQAGGTSIVGADVLRDAKAQMAIAADPQLGELAMLRDAYQFVLGACEQTILEASGLTKAEVAANPMPAPQQRQPARLVSTGEAV